MRGLVFGAAGDVELRALPIPSPGRGEVLVKVAAVGLCGSDLAAIGPGRSIETTPGAVLGHEISGVIVDGGEGEQHWSGQRVVVHPNVSCGRCHCCTNGRSNLCPVQYTLGIHRPGGAATYLVAPANQVHAIPNGLDGVVAALAEPLACVLNGVDKTAPRVGEAVVILGAGPIGLLFCAVFAEMGLEPVIVSEPSSYRAELARSMGAAEVINPRTDALRERVEHHAERGADIVVDSVGSLLGQAIDLAAPGGRILIFGAHPGVVPVDPLLILYREVSILGVFTSLYTFPRAVRFLHQHAALASSVVSHRFRLEQFPEATELMRAGSAGKVVLIPDP
jgi:threonine dehydrogenase-like Zn-dependent dehydrogenase